MVNIPTAPNHLNPIASPLYVPNQITSLKIQINNNVYLTDILPTSFIQSPPLTRP